MDRDQLLQMIRGARPTGVTGPLHMPKDVMQRTPIENPHAPSGLDRLKAATLTGLLGTMDDEGDEDDRRMRLPGPRIMHHVPPRSPQLFPLSALGGLGAGGLV